jgi:RNA-binding protein YhbY
MFGMPQQRNNNNNNNNRVVPLWNVPQTNREELKELPSIVEFPTPSQLKVLRKEATKRQASNTMARALLPPEEMYGPFTSSLPQIMSLLEERELVDVRGISKTDNRDVRAIAERLVNDLELELQRDVTIVSIKGYTATLYCPMMNNDNSSTKIQLFTSVGQKNSWVRRPKAPRDNRGQIIKDNNNSDNKATP